MKNVAVGSLTAENVHRVFSACLYDTPEEDKRDAVVAEGVTCIAGFKPDRLEAHRDEIKAMLDELPDVFRKSKGGGMSFLNMCMDRNDNQWTGLHDTMDLLVCLGLATKMLKFLAGRELWLALPGGMPYIVYDDMPAVN